jgi:hypothetical protein
VTIINIVSGQTHQKCSNKKIKYNTKKVHMGSNHDISLNWAPWMYLAIGATDPIYESRLGFYWDILEFGVYNWGKWM